MDFVSLVSQDLKKRSLLVRSDWLEACIDWLLSDEFKDHKPDKKIISEHVFEQFLLSDIQETSSPILPHNLKEIKFQQLTGSFTLQMNKILCISESFFSQKKKIEDKQMAVIKDENKTKLKNLQNRTLMLELTDGTSTYKAVECLYNEDLNESLKPGTKILLNGSIDCRNGIFLLTPSNVKLLGGFVDSLLEVNKPLNIISNFFQMPKVEDYVSTNSNTQLTTNYPISVPQNVIIPQQTERKINENKTANIKNDNNNIMESLKGVCDDNLSDLLCNDDLDDFDLDNFEATVVNNTLPISNIEEKSPKPLTQKVLSISTYRKVSERPFTYLKDALKIRSNTPFLSRSIICGILKEFSHSSIIGLKLLVSIDDGTMRTTAWLKNVALSNPPFYITRNLVERCKQGDTNSKTELMLKLKESQKIIAQSSHCLLLRFSQEDIDNPSTNLEILAIYQEIPDDLRNYWKTLIFDKLL